MKRILAFGMSVVLLAALLIGCGSSNNAGDTSEAVQGGAKTTDTLKEAETSEEIVYQGDVNKDGKIIVGVIAKNTTDVFMAKVNAQIENEMNRLKAEGINDEWTGIMDGLTDSAKQCDLAADCVNRNCDYVFILPAEVTASDPAVTIMAEAGIGVICINTKTDSSDKVAMCFAGSSDTYAGEIMGNYVMEKLIDGGKYIHLQGIIGNSAQVLRGEGISNTIGKSSKWINAADVPCDWDQSKAVNAVDDYISQLGDELKAVICDNDQMAVAAQAECNTLGRSDILCIGVDGTDAALEMISNNTMLATVLQDGVGQVNAAVEALVCAINKEKYEKEYIVPFVLITSENLSEYYTK